MGYGDVHTNLLLIKSKITSLMNEAYQYEKKDTIFLVSSDS